MSLTPKKKEEDNKKRHYSAEEKKLIKQHFTILFSVARGFYINGLLKISIKHGSLLYVLENMFLDKRIADPINHVAGDLSRLPAMKYNLIDIYTLLKGWIDETHNKHGRVAPETSYAIYNAYSFFSRIFSLKSNL